MNCHVCIEETHSSSVSCVDVMKVYTFIKSGWWTPWHYILYTIYYTLYTIYYILYTIYYIRILHTTYCILYTVYCILYTVYCVLYTVYCILCTIYANTQQNIPLALQQLSKQSSNLGLCLESCWLLTHAQTSKSTQSTAPDASSALSCLELAALLSPLLCCKSVKDLCTCWTTGVWCTVIFHL